MWIRGNLDSIRKILLRETICENFNLQQFELSIKGYNLLIDLCYVHPSFHASDFVPSLIYPYLTDEAKSMLPDLPPFLSDPNKTDKGKV